MGSSVICYLSMYWSLSWELVLCPVQGKLSRANIGKMTQMETKQLALLIHVCPGSSHALFS